MTQPAPHRPAGDLDDFFYAGPDRPAGAEESDPRARVGRLTPLSQKMDGFYGGVPLGFQALAVDATVRRMTIPSDAHSATVQVQSAAIRYTFDGTTPSPGTGHRADPGTILQVSMWESLAGFQAVQEGAGAAALAITYWS